MRGGGTLTLTGATLTLTRAVTCHPNPNRVGLGLGLGLGLGCCTMRCMKAGVSHFSGSLNRCKVLGLGLGEL